MKADILISEQLMNDTGENMFPGVLLHQIKASVPVDGSVNGCARFKGNIGNMKNDPVLSVGIFYGCFIEGSLITGLTAAFRIKCRIV